MERVPWWLTYADHVPVVFGHYWRLWNAADRTALTKGEPDLFADDAPEAWQRNKVGCEVAICIARLRLRALSRVVH